MYAGSNDNILWHFILKNWGKLHIFLKVAVWVKKNWWYFFKEKNLYATVYIDISNVSIYSWV